MKGSGGGRGSRLLVVGYVRVSRAEQAEEGVSLAAQEDRVRAYCALYDLEPVAVMADAGESARSLERRGLRAALGLLDSGAAAGLVVARLDRLTRSVEDLGRLLARYFGDAGGKQLFSVGDQIDTRTAAGRLTLNVLTSVAQWERETTVERTVAALGHKRRGGERTGSVPYGWRLDPESRRNKRGRPQGLVMDAGEQVVIRTVRAWADTGRGVRWIAGELTRLGVPTKTGRPAWSPSTVERILKRGDTGGPDDH